MREFIFVICVETAWILNKRQERFEKNRGKYKPTLEEDKES